LSNQPRDGGISPLGSVHFIEHLQPATALDQGCGAGTNLHTILNAGWQEDGVEFALNALMKARKEDHSIS